MNHFFGKALELAAKGADGNIREVDLVQIGFNLRPILDWRAGITCEGPAEEENPLWVAEVRRLWKEDIRPLLAPEVGGDNLAYDKLIALLSGWQDQYRQQQ